MHVQIECGDVHQHETLYQYLMKGYQDYNSSLFLNKQIGFCINSVQKLVFLYHDRFFYLGIVVFSPLNCTSGFNNPTAATYWSACLLFLPPFLTDSGTTEK